MYNHKEIEKKWQQKWLEAGIFNASDDFGKPKKYVLIEFPYPSGEGLHMGHLRPYVAGDVYSRFHRMNGYETMYPIGWDAFGLPAENFAIKKGVHPRVSTAKNIENAKRQIHSWGIGFDWSREINTTDPEYYKWTQWIFLQFFKAGLAYEATGLINWCPKDKTGLANEEVIDGRCERCGTVVEKKELRQWYLKITDYAEKLLAGLDDLDWPMPVKLQQKNWIGKSEGAEIIFPIQDSEEVLKVFTTRPDTLFGATYMVLAPEHPLVEKITTDDQKNYVVNYVDKARSKSEQERMNFEKDKTGVFTGAYAINQATNRPVPIWIADYVLSGYGTGAIMAVPAHDERDHEFAEKFGLEILEVVKPKSLEKKNLLEKVAEAATHHVCWTGEGELVNSGEFTGMDSAEAREKMTIAYGKEKIQYKLRDWVFSRQRYWGEPIPLIHCGKCGIVAVPDDQLPVVLPEVEKYEPTGTGESPLASIEEWVNVKCPQCSGDAKRETNTMPQWAGSSWYWIRYADPRSDKNLAGHKLQEYWTPVDVYFGGMEHTTLHLLYARFWNLFLHDQGIATAKEPFLRRIPHGIVLAADGEKMSKSRGNVVNPDVIVEESGADTLRMYELFLGPHETTVSWNDKGVIGVKRFLDKVYKFSQEGKFGADNKNIHKLIKRVTKDIENIKFNTAVAAFMEFLNQNKELSQENWESFLKLLAPFAPHLTEELWHELGHADSIHKEPWPQYDEALVQDKTVEIVVQVNGRKRGTIIAPAGLEQADMKKLIDSSELYEKLELKGKEKQKVIFVPDKLVNFVIEE